MGLFCLKDKAGQHSELAELNDHSVAFRAKSEFASKRQAHLTEDEGQARGARHNTVCLHLGAAGARGTTVPSLCLLP